MAAATQDVLETALRARHALISVMPVAEDGSKRPAVASWKRYQKTIASEDEVRARFASRTGIAFVCGAVSGGLEALDFDTHDVWEAFRELCHASDLGELLERVIAGYFERSPRGAHLFYRCPEARSTKLARLPRDPKGERKTIIETKGEGGYVIAAPSHGSVHPDGTYDLISGGIESIVTLTAEERALLHDVARALNQDQEAPTEPEHRGPALEPDAYNERPGDEFARRNTWSELLEPHGWKRLWTRDEVTYWRRPGKIAGVSATTNYRGSDLLYVFSTSTDFEAERGIGKFSAYAVLEHGGDFGAAARELHAQGYGTSRPALELVDLSHFQTKPNATPPAARAHRPEAFPMHLLEVPGLVGQLHRYIVESAPKPQAIIALGAAICAIGTLVGRRVQSETGTRTNVYVAALAETGAGKEWTRTAVRRAFRAVNLEPMVAIDDVTSDAAIYGVLQEHPSCLFCPDELGHQLSELKERKGGGGVLRTLMTLYGLARDVCYAKTYARDRRTGRSGNDIVIHQPNLCVYGTSVPGRFWASLSSAESLDGFLNRFLVLSSEDPNPLYRKVPVEMQGPPAALSDALERWRPDLAYQSTLGSGDPPPEALVVHASADAARVLDDLEDLTRERIARLHEEARPDHAALYVRTHEHASRLALIRAVGQGEPAAAEIGAADARWGVELAWWCAEHVGRCVELRIGDSEHDTRCKEAAAYLSTLRTVRMRDFTRRFQRWQPRERDEVIRTLVDSGRVALGKEEGKGRHPTVLSWVETTEAADA